MEGPFVENLRTEIEGTKGTQLLDRSVALLNYLGEVGEKGARVHEMAKALGLTLTTTHRIASALERHLLFEKDPYTRRYRLGQSLYMLGAKAADGMGLLRCCRPAILRLAAQTENTVSLMARSGLNIVCIDRQQISYVINSLADHIGGQVPLGVGSASRAILAFMPPEEANGIIAANAHRYSTFNGLSADDIHHQLPAIRERGYVLDQDHPFDGISSLAMPIRPQRRNIMGALVINATSARMPQERIPQLLKSIKREVQTIERGAISGCASEGISRRHDNE
ncbi:DNA-binding IclR family transcriptional regulator (plasmid) [Ensifer sp. WSM1721]|uniref:IclR family transcriptional regulator n=1 Tax=Ensifer sp. WSM1721 TaxID=1041159 RepID=UPI0006848BC6|nr:IclR family transcriptional regulator [Ensifer sp. WSM1721]